MRRIAAVALLSLAAFLPASAEAKEGPVAGVACGASGCAAITDAATVYQALRWEGTFALVARPRPAPFFTLVFSAPSPSGFRWSLVYAPTRRALRVDDRAATPPEFGPAGAPYWRTLTARQTRVLTRSTEGLRPFRASRTWRPRG